MIEPELPDRDASAGPVRQRKIIHIDMDALYADFQQITRSRTGQALFSTRVEQLSCALLEPLFPVTKGIRLLGMTLSSLGESSWKARPNSACHFRLTDSPT